MPRSMMSAESSGGVLSSVSLIASMICLTGVLERVANLLAGEDDRLREAGEHVAPAHLGLSLLHERMRGADLELDLLGRLLPDHQLVLALDVVDDRLVHLVAADSQRLGDDDSAERDDGDLAVVPPPMSTIMFPVGSATGSPAPIAAAIGSSIRYACRAPAEASASSTARFSTPVTPRGDADDDARMGEALLVHLAG